MLTMLATIAMAQGAAAAAPAPPPATPATAARMVALYEAACLQAFPDDAALDALMARMGATPIAPADVKVTLGDDPGRGWTVADGDRAFRVFLELPPYHACSVRGDAGPAPVDLSAYRTAVDRFAAGSRFEARPAMEMVRGGIRIRARVEERALPDAGGEALMVIEQQIVDPAKLAPGETSTPLRFVRQIRARP